MIYEELGDEGATRFVTIGQCAWCNGIRLGRRYVRIPGLPRIAFQQSFRFPLIQGFVFTTTHGLCEKCAEEMQLIPSRSRG